MGVDDRGWWGLNKLEGLGALIEEALYFFISVPSPGETHYARRGGRNQ
jgi:hypothetical protein